MVPRELTPKKIKLPETHSHSIVLVTGSSLRHQRFALRLKQEFKDEVICWFQFESSQKMSLREKGRFLCKKIKDKLFLMHNSQDIKEYIRTKGFINSAAKGLLRLQSVLLYVYLFWRRRRRLALGEKKLFQKEIDEMRVSIALSPVLIKETDSAEFAARIRSLSPYFFVSLGGPLYKDELLQNIRGIALNQHAGWSPDFKGANTIEWALYQRNLSYLGATVHMTTTGADCGPILYRSHPCLSGFDTPESCFLRVVALGTEMIIEAIKEIIRSKEITIYGQPEGAGMTYLNSQLDEDILGAIYRDFKAGWLKKEIFRLRSF